MIKKMGLTLAAILCLFISGYSDDLKDAKAHTARGVAYAMKGENDKAIENYSKAIEINPKDSKAYILRGVVYRKNGDYKKAAADERKCRSLRGK